MNLAVAKTVAVVVGAGLVIYKLFEDDEPFEEADATPPVVPVDEDTGKVVPTDATGAPIPIPSSTSKPPKIPLPKKPPGYQSTPRFLVKKGVYWYNAAFADVLELVLLAYWTVPTNPEMTRVTLVDAAQAKGPNARMWVEAEQKKGRAVIAPLTLLDGPEGQLNAGLISIPKSHVDPKHMGSTFAVLPTMKA